MLMHALAGLEERSVLAERLSGLGYLTPWSSRFWNEKTGKL